MSLEVDIVAGLSTRLDVEECLDNPLAGIPLGSLTTSSSSSSSSSTIEIFLTRVKFLFVVKLEDKDRVLRSAWVAGVGTDEDIEDIEDTELILVLVLNKLDTFKI